jgi:hypothetical protein
MVAMQNFPLRIILQVNNYRYGDKLKLYDYIKLNKQNLFLSNVMKQKYPH